MPYMKTFCPQCNERLMYEDTNGRINSVSPLKTEAELVYTDGHKARLVMCSRCLISPDLELLQSQVTHELASVPESTRLFLADKGIPITILEVIRS